ncbi:MAG: hypothetical protein QXO19_02510 [Candidatus Aenigmatarchaeota archaeon]
MQFRKLAAIAGSALMTGLTVAAPVMAATITQVNKISDLVSVTDSTVSFPLFVVGANAKAEDVAGAINVAVMLAGKATIEKSVAGTGLAKVDGPEREVEFGGDIDNAFGTTQFSSVSIPSLKEFDINFGGNKTTLQEKIVLGTGMTLDNNKDIYNGTVVAKDLGGFEYRIISTQTVDLSGLSATKPLSIKILGKDYLLTRIGGSSITVLKGTKGTIDATRSLTVGDYEIKFIMGSSTQAEIAVYKGGSLVDQKIITKGSTEEFDNGNLKIYLQNAYEFQVYGVAKAEIFAAVGSDIEKTINSGDLYTENDQSWQWDISFANTNKWGTSDYIGVKFSGTDKDGNTFYLKSGEKLMTPEDYTGFVFEGFTVNKYATITISPVSGFTVYNSTASSGYGISVPSSEVAAIKLSSDVPIFSISGVEGYQKDVYMLINKTTPAYVMVVYYDSKSSRYVKATDWIDASGATPVTIADLTYDQTTDTINYTTNTTQGIKLFGTKANNKWEAYYNYNSADKKIRLGTSDDAEAGDVKFDNTGSGVATVGTWEHDIVSDYGITLVNVKTNAGNNKVVIKYPAQQVKGKFGLGIQTSAAGGTTYKEAVPITSNVVKLDSEVSASDKSGYDLVLVGGPCVNSLVADLATAGKFDYTCENWPAENFGIIKVVKDAFTSGKTALIIAGTRAQDTMLAARVVQDGTKLASITSSSAKVTGENFQTVVVQ